MNKKLPARTPVPEDITALPQATAPQIGLILKLLDERSLLNTEFTRASNGQRVTMTESYVRCLAKPDATTLIQKLLSMPAVRKAPAHHPNVPDGRYALFLSRLGGGGDADRWYFFKIVTNERGWRKLYVLHSDEATYLKPGPQVDHLWSVLASNPQKAMADYGKQIGKCGQCARTLTNPDSIAAGIGPICAARLGW